MGASFPVKEPLGDEMEALKSYNEVLFHKLEKKMKSLDREVEEKSATEKKLESTVEALKKSNEELKKFAYATSHDLQEPLRMISLYVQLLNKKLDPILDAECREYINIVTKGAGAMSEMIKDIIDFSKTGGFEKNFAPVNLSNLVEDITEMFGPRINETGADIIVDKLPVVNGNREQLERLFQNLISNALKFYKNGEHPKLEITASMKDNYWLFCFKDNGIGISSKYFSQIFVLFQTLHSKSEYGGSGIGLALCKKIVENHGGSIWVVSEEGKGAAFYFTLPIVVK